MLYPPTVDADQPQEIEVMLRRNRFLHWRPITRSYAAYEAFLPGFLSHMETYEAFRVLLVTESRAVIGILTVGRGGLCGATVDPRLVFAAALKCLATGMILAHNHPSGDLKPSQSDLDLTERMVRIGELHNIPVLDHLILSQSGFLSFVDEGLM